MIELAYWWLLRIRPIGYCYICCKRNSGATTFSDMLVKAIMDYQQGKSKCDPRRCESCCEFH